MIVAQAASPEAISSSATASDTTSAPTPPHSIGTVMPRKPKRPISASASRGKVLSRSQAAELGLRRCCANCRAVSRIMDCCSLSIMNTPFSGYPQFYPRNEQYGLKFLHTSIDEGPVAISFRLPMPEHLRSSAAWIDGLTQMSGEAGSLLQESAAFMPRLSANSLWRKYSCSPRRPPEALQ